MVQPPVTVQYSSTLTFPFRTGQEHVNSTDAIGFIMHDFAGPAFDLLHRAESTIFGPTALKEVRTSPSVLGCYSESELRTV